ncbi:hypothetical protein BAZO_10408 [Schinkia azotoformans LMG 9581]|uniref:Uncharacterized protein n=1 Tax=Schinkia azotoformans LMG 9581 TaxID=1131731 RepID=K6C7K9_SCHAZ|nr:hypothetical protein BAZO_10408 [Schinkia azotoformans LMG 9581]
MSIPREIANYIESICLDMEKSFLSSARCVIYNQNMCFKGKAEAPVQRRKDWSTSTEIKKTRRKK